MSHHGTMTLTDKSHGTPPPRAAGALDEVDTCDLSWPSDALGCKKNSGGDHKCWRQAGRAHRTCLCRCSASKYDVNGETTPDDGPSLLAVGSSRR